MFRITHPTSLLYNTSHDTIFITTGNPIFRDLEIASFSLFTIVLFTTGTP